MADIQFSGGLVIFEELTYSVDWFESLGPDCIHLCLKRADQELIQCYKSGQTSVNENTCNTVAEILAALGNPPPKPAPVE